MCRTIEAVSGMNRRLSWALIAVFAGVAVSACGLLDSTCACDTAPHNDRGTLLAEDGRLFDRQGREVLLRGVNARVNGLFDVTFDDGRTALEEIPVFTAADCRFLAQEMGLNHLRLPVNWSGIEPKQRGVYDEAYIHRVAVLTEACAAEGIYTLVDLHQDAYSKEIGEDGAPLWAIVPPPTQLLEGPLHDLADRRVSDQTLAAFESFYDNTDGIQDAYAQMAAHLVARLRDVPGFIGLEIQNEPILYERLERLDAFHRNVAAAVRAIAPETTIFFEPNSTRNFYDQADVEEPFLLPDAVYSPHLYTGVFQGNWVVGDVARIQQSVLKAAQEAAAHHAALYVGEFGNSPNDAAGLAWIGAALDAMDTVRASWAFWLYEEYSQGGWGLYDAPTSGATRGALRSEVVQLLARPFPQAIAGRIDRIEYATGQALLRIEFHSSGGTHRISLPQMLRAAGAFFTCGVERVDDARIQAGFAEFPCNAQVIEMWLP